MILIYSLIMTLVSRAEVNMAQQIQIQNVIKSQNFRQMEDYRRKQAEQEGVLEGCQKERDKKLFPENCYRWVHLVKKEKMDTQDMVEINNLCHEVSLQLNGLKISDLTRWLKSDYVTCSCKQDLLLAKRIILYKMKLNHLISNEGCPLNQGANF